MKPEVCLEAFVLALCVAPCRSLQWIGRELHLQACDQHVPAGDHGGEENAAEASRDCGHCHQGGRKNRGGCWLGWPGAAVQLQDLRCSGSSEGKAPISMHCAPCFGIGETSG